MRRDKIAKILNFERTFHSLPLKKSALRLQCFSLLCEQRFLPRTDINQSQSCEIVRLHLKHVLYRILIGCFDNYYLFLLQARNFLQHLVSVIMEILASLLTIKKQDFTLVSRHLHLPYLIV